MPLPQALRFRLAKRGIIQGGDVDKGSDLTPPVEEEVIAEDYDTPRKTGADNGHDNAGGAEGAGGLEAKMGHTGCPNKYNIYHNCTSFCKEKWGAGKAEPSAKYLRLKQRMLQKFPLPLNWTEVYDPGSGQHYYWEYESDYVSWLPPMHPRAYISESAAVLRVITCVTEKEKAAAENEKGSENEDTAAEEVNVERPERHRDKDRNDRSEDKERRREGEKRHREDDRRDWHDDDRRRDERSKLKIRKRESDEEDSKSSRQKDDKERKREGPERPRTEDRHREDKERSRGKGWKGNPDGALDPMDPAAYSDTPRGTWSTGLERKNEAKTGADTTAAGPLYQMRPYPSPGDVLRANKSSETRDTHKTSKSRRP